MFFTSVTSEMYTGNEKYAHICSECTNAYFESMKIKYKDEKLALILTCAAIDVYFSEELYESVKNNGVVTFGNFKKALNGIQYRSKNFTTFLVNMLKDDSKLKDSGVLRAARETKWNAADKKNKKYVLESVGYDCFDDESYTDENRKFLFNTLADYLTDDILEDPHKMQSVISLVKTVLQKESVDNMINMELRKAQPDYSTIKQLTDIKDKLGSDINKTANENGISAKSSGKSGKSSTALTAIMKEMSENGFEEIKVNIADIKTSESYKEISQCNARAIIDELSFTGDEYARMLVEQSEFVHTLQESNEKLQEDLRLVRCELKEEREKGRARK